MSDVHPKPDAFDDEAPTTLMPMPGDPEPADLGFVLSASRRPAPSEDAKRSVLEVHQVWGEALLDTRHAASGSITVGSATGYRWRLLGTDVAWVPRPLAQVLPFAPPLLSEVDTRAIADLPLDDESLGDDAVACLFEEYGGAWQARIRPGWDAAIADDDGVHDLTALRAAHRAQPHADGSTVLPIRPGDHVTITVGDVAFHARIVPASKRLVARPLDGLDGIFLGLLGVSAVIGLCFGLLIAALPGPPDSGLVQIDDRMKHIIMHKEDKPEPVTAKAEPTAPRSQKAPREAGKRGEETAPNDRAKGAARAQADRQIAESAGVLGALRNAGINEGFGGGVDAGMLADIGGLIGVKGAQRGTSGLSSRGGSIGGGGDIGDIGGVGVGCTPGERCSATEGTGTAWTKGKGRIATNPSEGHVFGGLHASEIDETIKRHLSQIRYCYQRQLQRHPGLDGKLVTRFVIASDGTVSKAETKRSTLGNPAVDRCVSGRLARITFPKPKGGGIVIVSYPFMFSAN